MAEHLDPDITSPFRAEQIPSVLVEEDLDLLREAYQIPPTVRLRIPSPNDRACMSFDGEVCLYESAFHAGLRLPFPPVVRALLARLCLSPGQLHPNAWRILFGVIILWEEELGEEARPLTVDEFLYCYMPKASSEGRGWWFFQARQGRQLITNYPSSNKFWKEKFFFISGEGWEFQDTEVVGPEIPRIQYAWGDPKSSEIVLGKNESPLPGNGTTLVESAKEKNMPYASLVTPEKLYAHLLGPDPRGMKNIDAAALNRLRSRQPSGDKLTALKVKVSKTSLTKVTVTETSRQPSGDKLTAPKVKVSKTSLTRVTGTETTSGIEKSLGKRKRNEKRENQTAPSPSSLPSKTSPEEPINVEIGVIPPMAQHSAPPIPTGSTPPPIEQTPTSSLSQPSELIIESLLSDRDASWKRMGEFVDQDTNLLAVMTTPDLARNLCFSLGRACAESYHLALRCADQEAKWDISCQALADEKKKNEDLEKVSQEHLKCAGELEKATKEALQAVQSHKQAQEILTAQKRVTQAYRKEVDELKAAEKRATEAYRKEVDELKAKLATAKSDLTNLTNLKGKAQAAQKKVQELQNELGKAKESAVTDYKNSEEHYDQMALYFVSGFNQLKRRLKEKYRDVNLDEFEPEPQSEGETEIGMVGAEDIKDEAQS
ncbi:hypothetical protein RHSIM_Rhsim08G0029200 [Rhododendron simsii]|uniref:Uncharacterized protein n=1 Tax=Rhododendron simsii TaxID=118357 RepID=A0A834GKR0_RHOSS|nr:hypothetical protein RHSIM_Rhsim08G0029200 [Rhododendron simsii]